MDKHKKYKEVDKSHLTPEQFEVTQKSATEMPFTGEFCDYKEPGIYSCIVCGQKLFESKVKFESGSGWPSFYQPMGEKTVDEVEDTSHGMKRIEAKCSNCGAHLGHIFDDVDPDLRQGFGRQARRYCINSAALKFEAVP